MIRPVFLFLVMVFTALAINPAQASLCDSWLDDGWEKVLIEDYQGALSDYSKAIECDKESALAYNNRGWAYKALGRYDQAIKDFDKAIKLDNNRSATLMALENRASCFIRLGRYEQGIKDSQRAIDGGHLFAYGTLGLAQMSLNQYRKAVKSFEKVMSVIEEKGLCLQVSMFDTFKICISTKEAKEWKAALKRAQAGPAKTPAPPKTAVLPQKKAAPKRNVAKSPYKKTDQARQKTSTTPVKTAATVDWSGGSLWIMSVGVSEYASAGYRLTYATSDAMGVADALKRQPGGLFKSIKSKVLLNGKVTRESVLSSIVEMAKTVTNQDTVLIFMAGHGVRNMATGSFYFLPYPANKGNFLYRGLHWPAFEEAVAALQTKVKKVVLLIDACNSGAIDLTADFTIDNNLAAQLAKPQLIAGSRTTGRETVYRGIEVGRAKAASTGGSLYKMTAAMAGEQAVERPEWAHGAFTYALLEGLGGGADGNKDGKISVLELFGYVRKRVVYLTGGTQHPSFEPPARDAILAKSP